MKNIILIFFIFNISFSQNFKGIIYDEFNAPVDNAFVVFKKSKNAKSIYSFTKTNIAGEFNFEVNKENKTYLEIKKPGFANIIDSIFTEKQKTYTLKNFINDNTIETVVIKKSAVLQKKDTLTYDASYLKTGNENKVEDLLKNIPSIEINKDGKIYFRGKEVENIQLDGDDLFGKNYTIASKNINSSSIDKIEIIEKYNKNKIRKGFENTENISINLKLKENEYDLSCNTDLNISYYLNDRIAYRFHPNVLIINKHIKGFLTENSSNIGMEYYPIFFEKKANTFSEDFISARKINSIFESETYLNNTLNNINTNAIEKVSKKLTINNSFNISNEKQYFTENNQTKFYTNNTVFNDTFNNYKNIKTKDATIGTTYSNTKTQLISSFKLGTYEDNINNSIFSNNSNHQNNFNNYLKKIIVDNELNQIVNKNLLVNFITQLETNNLQQNANFSQSLQTVTNNGYLLKNKLEIIKKIKKGDIKLTINNENKDNKIYSFLTNEAVNVSQTKNKSDLKSNILDLTFSSAYQLSNFNISTSLNFGEMKYKTKEESFQNNKFIAKYVNPTITLKFEKNKHYFKLQYYKENLPILENQVYNNYIQTSNRQFINNKYNLDYYYTKSLIFTHRFNEVFKAFNTLFSFNLQENNGAQQLQSNVCADAIFTTKELVKSKSRTSNINLSIEKYVKQIKATLKLHLSKNSNSYYNTFDYVTNLNSATTNTIGLFTKTTFKFPVNFQLKASYNENRIYINKKEEFKNSNYNFDYKLTTKLLKNKLLVILNSNHFILENTTKKSYSFLDIESIYKFKKADIKIKLTNLLDVKKYEEINFSDINYNIYSYSINRTQIMLAYTYNF